MTPSQASISHPIFARVYARVSRALESRGGAEHRRKLLEGLSGRVIEVGAGNGLNFSYYPQSVTEVVAVEPEARLRTAALQAAAGVDVPVQVIDGTANALPYPDADFDAGVASLVLCSVSDQSAALAELRRVIRPGGELRFYEHVRADHPRQARFQEVVDRVWPHLAGGCHTSRDTVSAIRDAGFELGSLDAFRFPESRVFLPPSPHVLGRATRVAAAH